MRKSQTKTIDGMTFTVQALPAMRQLRLKPRILDALAAPASKIAAAFGGSLASTDVAALGDALTALCQKLTPAEYEALTRELLETTTVQHDGQTLPLMPVFDDVMCGRTLTVDKLLLFALEVNYGDFFAAGRAAFATARLVSPSKESTGSPTAGQPIAS